MDSNDNNVGASNAGNEQMYALAITISHGGVDSETACETVHILTVKGAEMPHEVAQHMRDILIALCRSWGLDVAKIARQGEEVYNVITGVGTEEQEQDKEWSVPGSRSLQ